MKQNPLMERSVIFLNDKSFHTQYNFIGPNAELLKIISKNSYTLYFCILIIAMDAKPETLKI
jgi:hypothetical protein